MSLLGAIFGSATVILLVSSVGYFFTKLYEARMLVRDKQKKGQPVAPEHSFIFGHLFYLKKFIDGLPRGAHYQYAFGDIARKHFTDQGAFYIDLWPLSGLFLAAVSPQVAIQAAQMNLALATERQHLLKRFFKPIAGGPNLFDLPEKE
ncbi:MAG: hypothetical protein MMC33_007536 [Icmadophila ericetorum]|nr:hypothetical protein [Icmadophila ericetorum]